ncbi:hypothetical protein [Mycobacteroides salmoniphilum]|uniref:Uncharacterized protein n=1 Tax=Mycobacteroides salmoniphilum TaxID=404941 RepID=A0A4R8T0B8_9MYCO|nr:hypothetical protein [Mycobacteroides salmoniphilum]TEA09206.1 hypothetical protein CCUG60884_00196 [Mycobacteroides salmoniphilum]
MKITARVQRSGKRWVVDVPEIEDAVTTTVHNLKDVAEAAADAVHAVTGELVEDLEVTVDIKLDPDVADLQALAIASMQLSDEASAALKTAAKQTREAVAGLRETGLTLEDIAYLIDRSFSRVQQLAPKKAERKS